MCSSHSMELAFGVIATTQAIALEAATPAPSPPQEGKRLKNPPPLPLTDDLYDDLGYFIVDVAPLVLVDDPCLSAKEVTTTAFFEIQPHTRYSP